MKMFTALSRLTAVCAGLMLVAAPAGATPTTGSVTSYTDNYQGNTPRNYGDVIGDGTKFDISGAEVWINSTTLQIDIVTQFMKNGLGTFASYTFGNKGIGAGDLFLSVLGWSPTGTAPYNTDNLSNGTVWTHALALDDRWSSSGGTATLVALPYLASGSAANGDYILDADAFLKGAAIWRHDQPVAVDVDAEDVVDKRVTASWTPTTNGSGQDVLRFIIDLAGTDLLNQPLAVSWGMTCSNDVIQFETPEVVPEPGVIALFAPGLLMVLGYRRRVV